MAKSASDAVTAILQDISQGRFSKIYLLMGEEQYNIDKVYSAIMSSVLSEQERDFNQTVFYGGDVTGAQIAEAACRYPMMAERQVVAVREAQAVKSLEPLAKYAASPMDTTVLVLCYMGKSLDKRSTLYKNIVKNGTVLESAPVRDYELPVWISSFFRSKGCFIAPEAAALMAEHTGVDLSKIALEADKILKNLDSRKSVTVEDIESNVGVTRQFSVFELTKALSYGDAPKALRIAAHIGAEPKFALPAAVSSIFNHFYRILKYHAYLKTNPSASSGDIARELGVNPYFISEYSTAAGRYPIRRCMAAISQIKEYDFKSKGGDAGEATQGELLSELVSKLLS